MKKDNLNIEDLFSSSFETYQVEPDVKTWSSISKKMLIRRFMQFNAGSFNIYYLSAIILMTTCATMFFTKNETSNHKITEISKIQPFTTQNIRPIENKNIPKNNNALKILKIKVVKHNKTEKDSAKTAKTIRKHKIETIERVKSNKPSAVSISSRGKQHTLEDIKLCPPQPLFTIDTKTGCAPLTIKITNNTKYATDYEWTFGNGEYSTEKNPVFVYKEPGVYTITLKAQGTGGTALSFIDSIVVKNKLINKVTYSLPKQIIENEDFNINTNGLKTATYKWHFGDGHTSDQTQIKHKYKKAGIYSISLSARNSENCYDSVLVTKVKVVKSPNRLIFPNGFFPNVFGASSPRYAKHKLNNDVFFPFVKGTLSYYQIKIYAKSGVVLFETNDINIGWNGYYKNKLVPEGVYPYVVVAKFAGTSKQIQKRGNVTVLHKKNR